MFKTDHMIVFFNSLGLMYGAQSTIGRLWYNQSAAALGNIVGGAVFIALVAHGMNHWDSPIFVSDGGTLLGHDVESTRRAKEVDPVQVEPAHPGVQDSTSTCTAQRNIEDQKYSTHAAPGHGSNDLGVSCDKISDSHTDSPVSAFVPTYESNLQRKGEIDPETSSSGRWRTATNNAKSDPTNIV
jgi:hypothetical protein